MPDHDDAEQRSLHARVTVVICTYTADRLHNLIASVAQLKEQTPVPDEIIVVVNDNEGLAERVRESIGGITLVTNDRPGVSHARDAGVAVATGDLVAFIDDDALPGPGWLANLTAPFANDAVMMTSGRIDPSWVIGRPRWFPDEFLWVVGCSYRGLPDNGAVLRNPIGASMAIRTSVIETVGTFESKLGRISTDGNGCEETEYAIRAHRLLPGQVVVLAADSVAHHLVPALRTTPTYFLKRCWREGRSKAILVQITGPQEGLSAERSYVHSTVVKGALRGLRRPRTWTQSLAMISGLGTTALAYGLHRLRLSVTSSST